MRRVVITGMGCVTPIGNDVKSSWDAILNNKCGIDEIKNFDTTDFKVKLAGEVKNLNLEDYFDLKEIKNNDQFTLFARIASRQAIKDSEIDLEKIDYSRFGVCFASGIGGIETIYDNSVTLIERGPSRISPHFIPKSLLLPPA